MLSTATTESFQYLTKGWSSAMNSFRAVLITALFLLIAVPAMPAEHNHQINLHSRKFTPAALQKTALPQRSSELMNKHIIMQFERPLLESDKDLLAADGIELLSYIPHMAYVVKLTQQIDESLMNRHDIRWFGELYPDDKVSPLITQMGIGEWARRGGDKVEFLVRLHKDESIDYWTKEFERKYGAEILGTASWINGIELIVPEMAYLELSEEDAVIWVEQDDRPQEVNNNLARINNKAEILQASPYNLTGEGIVVAEWDGGQVQNTHPDLIGRVTQMDGAALHDHSCHVAGTVLGDGSLQGGTYRGMAPAATLLSHLWWGGSSEIQNEYTTAITTYGALVSTNSWGLGVGTPSQASCEANLGYYASANATLDEAIRGNGPILPITICWSAGNERGSSNQYCGYIGWTYHTIGVYGCGKNLITVGAINSSSSTMTSFSSWGPTDDGRIKPDVCGPGCTLHSCNSTSGYWDACGTSMSTPATAGIVALMNEALQTSSVGPLVLPSTIKGILINTAIDLGLSGVPNGPDYAFGHGKVDGVAAVDKIVIGEPSYFENEITTGTAHLYDLTVPSGADKLKVTLVWDDPGGTGVGGIDLINDLDLVLIDPFSSTEYPWVLDPASPSSQATKDVDRLNNVETVEVYSPTPGLWKARVTGYNVPDGPQKYSIVFTPDSINTPGNLAALAVFDNDDQTVLPGDSSVVDFWVTNVGAVEDTIAVTINDDLGWIRWTYDTSVVLGNWDSAHFQLVADVPGNALAGDQAVISCAAVSLADSFVTSAADVNVIAEGYYEVELADIDDDTIPSPTALLVPVILTNNGNDYDQVTTKLFNDLGWSVQPITAAPVMPPFSIDTIVFTVTVPAELPHLTVNNFEVRAASTQGHGDTVFFQTTVDNQFLPPQLLTPANPYYTQSRVGTFMWDGTGDSSELIISTNMQLTNVIRTYTGITDQNFTMPTPDSLADGTYYWAVKQYFGTNASSFQANPFVYAVDNVAPQTMFPISPINSAIVAQKIFSFVFSPGKAAEEGVSGITPDYVRIETARDSAFTDDLHTFEPISGSTYIIPDSLDEGRWFWRIEQADLAGNHSGFIYVATFILDSEAPAIPTLVAPADETVTDEDSLLFRWSAPPPPVWEFSSEYYRIQMSTSPLFLSLIKNQVLYTDSIKLASNIFPDNQNVYWRVKATDSAGHSSSYQSDPFNFIISSFICGDVNSDGNAANTLDLNYLINYIFRLGSAPEPFIAGSVNCDSSVNILDLNHMINYIFRLGPPPCCE